MDARRWCLAGLILALGTGASAAQEPLAAADLVVGEADDLLVGEAEHYVRQSLDEVRRWYLATVEQTPDVAPDGDPNHSATASGGACLEVLPDTRRGDRDKLISGENFSNEPGKMAVLDYPIEVITPGRYYVWARIYSTNAEDNGLHVGLDGTWPESGRRMQWTEKNTWTWGSKQRTNQVHTGVPYLLYLDIDQPGQHVLSFAMREDGVEFDKWLLTRDQYERITGPGPDPVAVKGRLPEPFATPEPLGETVFSKRGEAQPVATSARTAEVGGAAYLLASAIALEGTGYYLDRGRWLAINPAQRKDARVTIDWPFGDGQFHLVLHTVGENDGASEYELLLNDASAARFTSPVASGMYEEGPRFVHRIEAVPVPAGAKLTIASKVASADGQEFSRARWSKLVVQRADGQPLTAAPAPWSLTDGAPPAPARRPVAAPVPRQPDGAGTVTVSGELRAWHKITLTIDGPFAAESDTPSPFLDYALTVTFRHADGLTYVVPGYFAADGEAANSGASAGTMWQAHLSPDLPGEWSYIVAFRKGPDAAVTGGGAPVAAIDGQRGTFVVAPTDKTGRDLRGKGRLRYVGERYLRFAGTGEYFLKQGADAPENLLSYADFDGDFDSDGHKDHLVKTWAPHVRDWRDGDPTWAGGKGKGLIGALNYLAGEGMNAYSFLTLNIGGDDQNAFPYVSYDDFERFDVSRLAQWEIVFEHADRLGLFQHFKTQETENEMLLDDGNVGRLRSVYYRELVARFGHHLALNWNLGEENGSLGQRNQSTEQRIAMTRWFAEHDPYQHLVAIHNGKSPDDLLGDASALTGYSLQTNRADFSEVHSQVVTWIARSAAAGKPWAVACDEPGDASHALLPDADDPTHDNARRNALWGTLLGGGWGDEWYFGYQHAESDLSCQDWRSRDLWWDQCRIALEFFRDQKIPFWEMNEADALVGNPKHAGGTYAFAKPGELYLVFYSGGRCELDLTGAPGAFDLGWFNPRTGGAPIAGAAVDGGGRVALGPPPGEADRDWLIVLRRRD